MNVSYLCVLSFPSPDLIWVLTAKSTHMYIGNGYISVAEIFNAIILYEVFLFFKYFVAFAALWLVFDLLILCRHCEQSEGSKSEFKAVSSTLQYFIRLDILLHVNGEVCVTLFFQSTTSFCQSLWSWLNSWKGEKEKKRHACWDPLLAETWGIPPHTFVVGVREFPSARHELTAVGFRLNHSCLSSSEPCGTKRTASRDKWLPGWRPLHLWVVPASPSLSSRCPRSLPRWSHPNPSSTPTNRLLTSILQVNAENDIRLLARDTHSKVMWAGPSF